MWAFLIGKNCVQVSGFRDPVTADGEPIRARIVVIIVVHSIQNLVEHSSSVKAGVCRPCVETKLTATESRGLTATNQSQL